LEIELWEIPQWNCCGAFYAQKKSRLLAVALPARNLALAERNGLNVAVNCAACYNKLKAAREAVKTSVELQKKVSEVIEMEYIASNDVLSIIEVFEREYGLDKIASRVEKPLAGLKVVSYYGCLLVRPAELAMDDQEDPQSLDRIVAALGGIPVDWSQKVECCGAFHSTYNAATGFQIISNILAAAVEAGADCVACACPVCMLNLDMRQGNINKVKKTNFQMPVFYFTELMGLAMGISPKELGIKKHFIDPQPLLKARNLL
jgi:heterodisulfide reductase subunit B